MTFANALVVLAVVGAGDSKADAPDKQVACRRVEAPPGTAGPLISYEARIVRVGSIDWRGKYDGRLKPVGRQGGAVVWTASAATLKDLLTDWAADPATNVAQAPQMIAHAGDRVTVESRNQVHYVGHLERVDNGPAGAATSFALEPEVAQVGDGLRAELSAGRLADDGLRTRLTVELERLRDMLTTTRKELLETPDATGRGKTQFALNGQIQVPRVDLSRVEGEWVVPRDGVLIVGLGPRTISSGRMGREQVGEDLMVIGYRLMPVVAAD